MADRLRIYNEALGHLRVRPLASLTENAEKRRPLDAFYDGNNQYCLSQSLWRFARRVESMDAAATVTPQFSFTYAFVIPTDWKRTVMVSAAPQLNPPLDDYAEEAGYWYANVTPFYVSYVSNDPRYGMNLGAWPDNFTEYVAIRLAAKAGPTIADAKLVDVKDVEKAKREAKGIDPMNDPRGQTPLGTWARSRLGNFGRGGIFGPGSLATGPSGDD